MSNWDVPDMVVRGMIYSNLVAIFFILLYNLFTKYGPILSTGNINIVVQW